MKTQAGVGLLFISPLGEHMRYAVRLHFPASNNMTEYEALLCGLRIAIETGIKRLNVRGDSQLVIDQVMKNASCHNDKMEAYCNVVRALEDMFYGIEEPSGAPSNLAGVEPMDKDPSNEAFVLSLLEGYDADEVEAMDTEPAPRAEDWRAKYLAWMDRGELPSDRSEARRIARMAKSFTLVNGELYKRVASGILQQCIPIPQGRELLRDIHAGVCGHHVAPRTLVGNAFRQDFYWPAAVADAMRLCAPAKGADSTSARAISRLTPSR
jgi:hypothetical protein